MKSPWVSTKDKLPFLQSWVLVVLNGGSVSTARMCIVDGDKCWNADKNPYRYLELEEVLYWMPIPKLPKGGTI